MTYYTIIGRNLELFKWHYNNVCYHGGLKNLPQNEFLVIIYTNPSIDKQTTDSIVKFCDENEISYYIHEEVRDNFIENLYDCWNLGYEKAKYDLVFRGGSDQAFSLDSFPALLKAHEENQQYKVILQANTVECATRIAQIGAISRHFVRDFGDTYKNFNIDAFDDFTNAINSMTPEDLLDIKQAVAIWQHPTGLQTTNGYVYRCDGCSWLMEKDQFKLYGPLPAIENGITGDVVIHDRMQNAGYEQLIVKNCCTYHLVQGERT
jgi:hypothetical protein